MTTETPMPSRIEFFFDPSCPWTWATSRWLVEAAAKRNVEIGWRACSLAVINADRKVPEQFRKPMEVARQALRVLVALGEHGRNDVAAAFYTEYGRRVHHDGDEQTIDLVRQLAEAVGVGDSAALDDATWDDAVEASTKEAVSLAGADVGSPILAFGDPRFAVFGPIVSPPPTGNDAERLLDLVLSSATIPGFFELKRGRDDLEFGPRP